jgi:hypothetical protein
MRSILGLNFYVYSSVICFAYYVIINDKQTFIYTNARYALLKSHYFLKLIQLLTPQRTSRISQE